MRVPVLAVSVAAIISVPTAIGHAQQVASGGRWMIAATYVEARESKREQCCAQFSGRYRKADSPGGQGVCLGVRFGQGDQYRACWLK
jgi:hypothetical protein